MDPKFLKLETPISSHLFLACALSTSALVGGRLELHAVVGGRQHTRSEEVDQQVEPLVQVTDGGAVAFVDDTDAVLALVTRHGEHGQAKVSDEDAAMTLICRRRARLRLDFHMRLASFSSSVILGNHQLNSVLLAKRLARKLSGFSEATVLATSPSARLLTPEAGVVVG